MNPTFLARVAYAVDFLSTFTSTQLANGKRAQQTQSQDSKNKPWTATEYNGAFAKQG